jgi:PhoPQ-activated pathogenicity-related protein
MARLAQLGSIGLGTYVCLSICTWTTFFIAIENNLDVGAVLKWIWGDDVDTDAILASWGIAPKTGDEHPATMYGYLASKAPSAILASVASKALAPVKIPIAMALTPYVHRVLMARGFLRKSHDIPRSS